MPNANEKIKYQAELIGQIAPVSVAAAGSANTGATYFDAGKYHRIEALAPLGVLGGGTVTLTMKQAKDSTGTGAKDLTAGGFASVNSATNGAVLSVEEETTRLDVDNGFTHVRAELSNVGGTGALVALTLRGVPRYTDRPSTGE